MAGANRFLKEVFLPQHNARLATPAEDQGTAFVPFTGALDDILCIHEERTVSTRISQVNFGVGPFER